MYGNGKIYCRVKDEVLFVDQKTYKNIIHKSAQHVLFL